MKLLQWTRFLLTATFTLCLVDSTAAFIISVDPGTQAPAVPWTSTASGARTHNGEPATLTWSFVPDATTILGDAGTPLGASDLISFLNANFDGDPLNSDLTQQPWFHFFEDSLDRWTELGGATYVYEPADDGSVHSIGDGVLGVRGDIRIGGVSMDGPSGTLAFSFLPDYGSDLVLDTGDATFFTNAGTNYVQLRNTVLHELGHGFGLLHVVSSSDDLLMEPLIDSSFDGPQLDEVRGIHFHFGDFFEKSNSGLGNETAALATDLGTILGDGTVSVGHDADVPSQFISSSATDFVSISNASDVDFFCFTVSQPSHLDAVLTPLGGTFTQAAEGLTPTPFDAAARSNLALTILDTDGTTILASADATGQGGTESIGDLRLALGGKYFAQITGADATIQLYELNLTVTATGHGLLGDVNLDGDVNGLDVDPFVAVLLNGPYQEEADINQDGHVDGVDVDPFVHIVLGLGGAAAVPEPSTVVLAALGLLGLLAIKPPKPSWL